MFIRCLGMLDKTSNFWRMNEKAQWASMEPWSWSHRGRFTITGAFCFTATLRVPKLPLLRSREVKTFDRMEATFGKACALNQELFYPQKAAIDIKDAKGLLGVKGKVLIVVNHSQQGKLGRHWVHSEAQISSVCKPLFVTVKLKSWLLRVWLLISLACILHKM